MKRALIFGGLGQDGKILTRLLKEENYKVIVTSRQQEVCNDSSIIFCNFKNQEQINLIIKNINPHEVYFLSGQSSVGKSFEFPNETFKSFNDDLEMICKAISKISKKIKLFHPSSSEVFGNIKFPANESTEHSPLSPYAHAKSAAVEICNRYRERDELKIVNGYLFNHESEFRGNDFVTARIINQMYEQRKEKKIILELGNTDIVRDWGYAEDHMTGAWLAMKNDKFENFVFATGKSHSLKDFIFVVASNMNLSPEKIKIESNKNFLRKSDIQSSFADPSKALNVLNWYAKVDFETMTGKILKHKFKGIF